jgi:hypothetical protein
MNEKPETIRLVWDAIDTHGGTATSTQIWRYLSAREKKYVIFGYYWVLMDRLAEDGYVRKSEGEINPRRGNRPDILYRRGGGLIEKKREEATNNGLARRAAA